MLIKEVLRGLLSKYLDFSCTTIGNHNGNYQLYKFYSQCHSSLPCYQKYNPDTDTGMNFDAQNAESPCTTTGACTGDSELCL